MEAFEVTSIYAHVVGYVRSWSVNIGSKIKKGQVLAELDVPEIHAEAEQKRALVEQAEAQRDQARAAAKVADADVVFAQAKVAAAGPASGGSRRTSPAGKPSTNASVSCSGNVSRPAAFTMKRETN